MSKGSNAKCGRNVLEQFGLARVWTFLSYDLWSALIFRITSSSSAMKFVYLQRTNLLIYFTTNLHQESFYKKAPAVIHTTGNQSCLRL